ncbi:MAG: TatD family hydrolase [Rhodothermaceae bacterium]|nr:MAG: TatD family hydrolase [Rhodothermaceae bacterium]
MLIDTHAHLYLDRFDEDRDAMLERARAAGVGIILMPAIDVASIHRALRLCETYEGLYAMAALHPSETKTATGEDFAAIAALCDHPKVVAVGESGLDYYWDRSFDERQQAFFRRHIRLAAEKDLPLVLHNRAASEDLVRILREERRALARPERLRGVFHCFEGPAALAEEAAALGFLIGVGGLLVNKKAVARAVAGAPLSQIVLETDAPYLAPEPHRGRRNEPAYLRLVAERLAELKGLTVEEVERITTGNARRLFGLPAET